MTNNAQSSSSTSGVLATYIASTAGGGGLLIIVIAIVIILLVRKNRAKWPPSLSPELTIDEMQMSNQSKLLFGLWDHYSLNWVISIMDIFICSLTSISRCDFLFDTRLELTFKDGA